MRRWRQRNARKGCTELAPRVGDPSPARGGSKRRLGSAAARWLTAMGLALAPLAGWADGPRELDDQELAGIVAGTSGVEFSPTLIELPRIERSFGARRVVFGGSAELVGARRAGPLVASNGTASIVLSESAQSQLRSLVNVNAVNSVVDVLVNLNLTVHSSVGEVNQINLRNFD